MYEMSRASSKKLIWEDSDPDLSRRARRREQIARTAIELADAEGFGAVSMRRVAEELGAGTMTLYHYVRNKDELIALIDDEISGELLLPHDELPSDWREALAAVARLARDSFMRHPWKTEIPPLTEGGANGGKYFEQMLRAASGTGLDAMEQVEIASLLDDYVLGFAIRTNALRATGREPARLAEEFRDHAREAMDTLALGDHPHVAALFADRDPVEVLGELLERALGAERFERGLDLLLDGIERRIARHTGNRG
jgi:AcrR family transcriptional regulator